MSSKLICTNLKNRECNFSYLFEQMMASGYSVTNDFPIVLDHESSPWVFADDPSLRFSGYYQGGNLMGITISRHLAFNSHLHALWVSPTYQNRGVGSEIMKIYIEQCNQANKSNLSLTLHVYKSNAVGINFYSKNCGFRRLNDDHQISENIGLQEWIQNCKDKNDWPLREGLSLMWRQSK